MRQLTAELMPTTQEVLQNVTTTLETLRGQFKGITAGLISGELPKDSQEQLNVLLNGVRERLDRMVQQDLTGLRTDLLAKQRSLDRFCMAAVGRTKAGKSTITDISDPTITVFRPEKPNGTSVIVAPGGAYIFLSAIHEGTQVCEWLSSIGVTGILLKYRTPTRDESAPHDKPVADAAKAIALVRERAKEWQLDPNRVGLLGFSAGGNLLAHIACDRPAASALPNFGVMIYGGGFLDSKEPTKLKEGFTVPADAPPMFIACAHDDGQNPVASTLLYLEYKKHSIPAELHLFTKGGHGFGMRDNKQPINAWPQRCAEWLDAMGWMTK
jgi:acetyl esterase/lipase